MLAFNLIRRLGSPLAVAALAFLALSSGSSNTEARAVGTLQVKIAVTQDGRHLTGDVIITNRGRTDATIHDMSGWLEAHVQGNADPGLPTGSSPRWFKIADASVANPGVVPAGTRVVIPYSVDLCAAAFAMGGLPIRSLRSVVELEASQGGRVGTSSAHASFKLSDFICF